MSNAIYAGMTAWGIELAIAGLFLYILYREEQKVYRRRRTKDGEKESI